MLYKESVNNETLELIINLQNKKYLQKFYLVGGTALALQLGHRQSIDIDLFSNFSFDAQEILEQLSYDFQFKLFYSTINTLKGSINNIQVDILAHRYQYIAETIIQNNISMVSLQDIAAMKLNAISTNGQRAKDFIDIFYLLKIYKMSDIINFYKKKYNQDNDINILKSLIYFDDVDIAELPVMLREPKLKWSVIKKTITKTVTDFVKNSK